jgi:hypothetical protein
VDEFARHGVWTGELGMLLAVTGTLLHRGIVDYKWLAAALVLGTIFGVPLGKVAMTAVPQRTALSHAFGALCVTLVGTVEFYLRAPSVSPFMMAVLGMEAFAHIHGQLDGRGKAAGNIAAAPITYKGQTSSTSAPGRRRNCGCDPGSASGARLSLSADCNSALDLRRAHDHPHRRRGHADSHLAIEFVCRIVSRRDGFRAQ